MARDNGSSSDANNVAKSFVYGGIAGMVARTVIAPAERIKIIFQTRLASDVSQGRGWVGIIRKVVEEGGGGARGVVAFWRGNSVAVVRVFPYLGIQLSSNDQYKNLIKISASSGGFTVRNDLRNFVAGSLAGMTAVATTYPLDLARARMALLMEQGVAEVPSMLSTMRSVYLHEGGFLGLYSGAGISCTGAALYCGIKFASYDTCKGLCRRYLLADPNGPPGVLHQALSGAAAGFVGQTCVYPFDVLRRRLQTGGVEARKKYPNTIQGFWRLYCEEGVYRGLYRGCSLNYLKTIPNTTVYLALFDILKENF